VPLPCWRMAAVRQLYCTHLFIEQYLYGPAVVVWSGGIGRSRVRVEPMGSTEEGERRLVELATRRERNGYQRVSA
jgi:hypothetical protein